eukprot:scaffold70660_cov30-Phaeocystis_antarctica.AAC.1
MSPIYHPLPLRGGGRPPLGYAHRGYTCYLLLTTYHLPLTTYLPLPGGDGGEGIVAAAAHARRGGARPHCHLVTTPPMHARRGGGAAHVLCSRTK